MSTPPPRPSALDRFELRKRLGAGAMGVVFEAYDRERGEIVALKILPDGDANALYRFKREFRTLADIAHPNLVNLFELFVDGTRCFFTMEKIDGESFLRHVRPGDPAPQPSSSAGSDTGVDRRSRGGSASTQPPGGRRDLAPSADASTSTGVAVDPAAPAAPAALAVDLVRLRPALRQLVEGVAALHAAGTLHRDLKPSNVLVDREGRVVILDFGLATSLRELPGGDGLTGTAAYMAPEQGDGQSAPASDWYAVGVMLYEALTGQRPFAGNLLDILVDKRRRPPRRPDQLAAGLPADLVDLCMRLLDREPGRRPDAPEILAVIAGRAPADAPLEAESSGLRGQVPEDIPLVGREADLAALRDAARQVAAGDAVAVYVHGPSGAGKSALCLAFLDELQADPEAVILRGRCYAHESVPYKALDGVVDSLSRLLARMDEDEARTLLPRDAWALARLFPVMYGVLDTVLDRRADARRAGFDRLELRRRAFAALRDLLTRLADRRRVVIHIDDLHWADADSAILLDDLLRPPDAPPLLLLASFRAEEIEHQPFLRDLLAGTGSPTRRALPLGPLGEAELRALAERLLDGHPAAERHAAAIVREAAGSPFLAEQLVSHVLAGAALDTAALDLGAALSARIAAEPPGAAQLLDALAVAAHPLESSLAARAANLEGDERPLVKRLLADRLLRVSGPDEAIELYHDRLREALVARLGDATLRDTHRRLAIAMEGRGLEDYEVIFGHYRGAGNRTKAALYADRAATKAAEALAFDQAALFYRRAIELAPQPEEEALAGTAASRLNSARLERGLADALANAGRCREAARAYLRAAELVDQRRALELRRAAAEQLLVSGHLADGRRVLDEVLAQVGWRLAPTPRRALLSLFGRRLRLRLHGLSFRPVAEREIPPDKLLLVDICSAVATGLSMVDTVRAADFQARGTLMALEAGDPPRVAHALGMEAFFTASAGGSSKAEAAALSQRSLDLASQARQPEALAQATMIAGVCAYYVGEWRRAAGLLGDADLMLRERCRGQIWQKVTTQRFGLDALIYLGEFGELARRLPAHLRDAEERGNLYSATALRARLGLHWLAQDDPQGHRRELAEALRRWPADGYHVHHFDALRSLCQADLYEGDHGSAARRIAAQWDALDGAMLLRIQNLRVEAHHLRAAAGLAALAADAGDRAALTRSIQRDIAAIAGEGMAWSDPLARLLRAGLAARRRDDDAALADLEAALAGFKGADMALHAALAERALAARIGGDAGAERVGAADAWLRSQGVRDPDRLARALAPGLFRA